MSKKLFAALMALAAIGAFAAASASANPIITHPTGTTLATGTKITATNIGETKMTTPFGNVTCSTATLTGTLTENETTDKNGNGIAGIQGDITFATFGGTGAQALNEPHSECTSTWTGGVSVTPNPATNGLPWCVKATTATDEIQLRGGSCTAASRPIRFVMVFTSIGTCTYQRTAAAVGTLTTDVSGQDATASITEQEWTLLEGGGLCPASGKLDMSFTLETDTETASPLYFSS